MYPIGVPAFYLYLLFSARADIISREDVTCSEEESNQRMQRLRPLRLLYETYEPKLWFWALVETARRLMLTGFLVVIAQGSAVQIVVAIMLSLFFLKLYDSWKPYVDGKIQSIEAVAQWQVFFVLFLALLLKADFGSLDIVVLDVCLVVAIFANVLLDLVKFVMTFINAKDRHVGDARSKEVQINKDIAPNPNAYAEGGSDFECSSGRMTEMTERPVAGAFIEEGMNAVANISDENTTDSRVERAENSDAIDTGEKVHAVCSHGTSSKSSSDTAKAVFAVSSPFHGE